MAGTFGVEEGARSGISHCGANSQMQREPWIQDQPRACSSKIGWLPGRGPRVTWGGAGSRVRQEEEGTGKSKKNLREGDQEMPGRDHGAQWKEVIF